MHPVLARQLRKLGLDPAAPPAGPEGWAHVLERVSRSYSDADQDRYLLERSLAISSREMQELYEGLRRASETRVAAERDRLRAVFSSLGVGLCILDADLRVQSANPEAERLLAVPEGGLIERSLHELLAPAAGAGAAEDEVDEVSRLLRSGQAHSDQDTSFFLCDGTALPVTYVLTPVMGEGSFEGAVLVFRDNTEQKRHEAALRHLALHDTLTGLPNRALLQDRLDQAVRAAERSDSSVALLLLDLDRFKEVNDTLGHHPGDLLLQQIGPRLRATLRASDSVARLGGDEFAVILPDTDTDGAIVAALKLRSALDQPFVVEEHRLMIGASVGVALYPEHGHDVETLMRRADVAMYVAKRGGTGVSVYAATQDDYSLARLALASELQQAIASNHLVAHYQPVINLASGLSEHVEALVRWQHSRYGMLPPDRFIPLAEQTGLIIPLTQYVAGAALRQCALWLRDGIEIGVAVNLSARTLHDPALPQMIADLFETYRLPPACLKLELTESTIMLDPDRALRTLSALHAMGVRLSIDDFGTGYSSLAYLQRLPVDEIKIDRSFVQHMATNMSDQVIVRSTIDLAHNLGLRVVAEGVEDRETCVQLAGLSCDLGQGYYFARPMPAESISRLLGRITVSDLGARRHVA